MAIDHSTPPGSDGKSRPQDAMTDPSGIGPDGSFESQGMSLWRKRWVQLSLAGAAILAAGAAIIFTRGGNEKGVNTPPRAPESTAPATPGKSSPVATSTPEASKPTLSAESDTLLMDGVQLSSATITTLEAYETQDVASLIAKEGTNLDSARATYLTDMTPSKINGAVERMRQFIQNGGTPIILSNDTLASQDATIGELTSFDLNRASAGISGTTEPTTFAEANVLDPADSSFDVPLDPDALTGQIFQVLPGQDGKVTTVSVIKGGGLNNVTLETFLLLPGASVSDDDPTHQWIRNAPAVVVKIANERLVGFSFS